MYITVFGCGGGDQNKCPSDTRKMGQWVGTKVPGRLPNNLGYKYH